MFFIKICQNTIFIPGNFVAKKMTMRYIYLLFIAFLLLPFACSKIDLNLNLGSTCHNPETDIELSVRDFYSNQPIDSLDFTLFVDYPYCYYWCWDDSIQHLTTDATGKARLKFIHEQERLAEYYLVTFKQKRYFQINALNINEGCPNVFDVRVKPANTFSLTLFNTSNIGFGPSTIRVSRDLGFHHETSISSDEWPSHLASVHFDTIPPGFSRTISFPAVPEEKIFIEITRKNKFIRDTVFTLRTDTMLHSRTLAF